MPLLKQKKLKITGLTMTVRQWFKLMRSPYQEKALKEMVGNYKLDTTTTSLPSALNKFNWEGSQEGRSFWEPIVKDLQNGRQSKYVDSDTITQIID